MFPLRARNSSEENAFSNEEMDMSNEEEIPEDLDEEEREIHPSQEMEISSESESSAGEAPNRERDEEERIPLPEEREIVNEVLSSDSEEPSDAEMDPEFNLMEGAERPLFQGVENNLRMHRMLQNDVQFLLIDHFLIAVTQNLAHRETYESLLSKLRWIDESNIESGVPTTKKQLWRTLNRDESNLIYSVYCTLCKEKVGTGKQATRVCSCGSCGPGLKNENLGVFILTKIIPQLQEILKIPSVAESLRYRDERIKIEDDNIEDIYDGAAYKKLREEGNFLSNPNNLSFILWVDGVSLAKSSNTSAYVILLEIAELPPHARSKHVVLVGIFVGNHKPEINTIMFPVAQQLMFLYLHGLPWRPNGGPEIISKFITIIFTADSVERAEVLRIKPCTGYNSCIHCYILGEYVEGRLVFPYGNYKLRTHDEIFEDMIYATLGIFNNGLLGFSALAMIPSLNLFESVVHDDCHGHFEGGIKQLTKGYLEDSTTDWYIGTPSNLVLIDQRLAKIKFPSVISRHPRSITTFAKWKATELRNWLLYCCLPCLDGILKPKYFNHLSLYCQAVFILNNASISQGDLLLARAYLTQFRSQLQMFGKKFESFNFHIAGHSPISANLWGPSWAYSTFPFESFCAKLKDSVTSPNGRAEQIVTRFFMRKYVESALELDGVSERTKNEIKRLLQINSSNIPEGFPPGHYFVGVGNPVRRLPEAIEIEALRAAEEVIDNRTIIDVYTKADIHGVSYEQRQDNDNREFCNSVVYTKFGFYFVQRFLSYRNEDNFVAGIFGQPLEEIGGLYLTHYINEVVPKKKEIAFVSYRDVIVPGIFFRMNNKNLAIPVSNISSVD